MVKLILNSISLIIVLIINYLSNTGAFSLETVGEISRKYDTLFTPAGYAFSIWGLIYVLLTAFVIYQWVAWFKRNDRQLIDKVGYWFISANIANGLWVIAWINESIGISVVLMLLLLVSLIQLVLRLDLEIYDAPLSIIGFVWWPLTIYFGWIVLATIANISAFLIDKGWQGTPLSGDTWAIIMILISAFLYALLIYSRNMREAALVGVWGLLAIVYRQWDAHDNIAYAALVSALMLMIYIFLHAYRNRFTSVIGKIFK